MHLRRPWLVLAVACICWLGVLGVAGASSKNHIGGEVPAAPPQSPSVPWWHHLGRAVKNVFHREPPRRFDFPTESSLWFDQKHWQVLRLDLRRLGLVAPDAEAGNGVITITLWEKKWLGRRAKVHAIRFTAAQLDSAVFFNMPETARVTYDRNVVLEARDRDGNMIARSKPFKLVHVGRHIKVDSSSLSVAVGKSRAVDPATVSVPVGSSFGGWDTMETLTAHLMDACTGRDTGIQSLFRPADVVGDSRAELTFSREPTPGWYYVRVVRKHPLLRWLKSPTVYESTPVCISCDYKRFWSAHQLSLYAVEPADLSLNLIAAVGMGNEEWATRLLALGADINRGDGMAARLAVMQHNEKMIKFLARHNAFEDKPVKFSGLLTLAVEIGNELFVDLVQSNLELPNDCTEVRRAFLRAIDVKKPATVSWFLAQNLLYNLNFDDGAAIRAAAGISTEITKLLIGTHRVDVHAGNDQAYLNAVAFDTVASKKDLNHAPLETPMHELTAWSAPKFTEQIIRQITEEDKAYYLDLVVGSVPECDKEKLLKLAAIVAVQVGALSVISKVVALYPTIVNDPELYLLKLAAKNRQLASFQRLLNSGAIIKSTDVLLAVCTEYKQSSAVDRIKFTSVLHDISNALKDRVVTNEFRQVIIRDLLRQKCFVMLRKIEVNKDEVCQQATALANNGINFGNRYWESEHGITIDPPANTKTKEPPPPPLLDIPDEPKGMIKSLVAMLGLTPEERRDLEKLLETEKEREEREKEGLRDVGGPDVDGRGISGI